MTVPDDIAPLFTVSQAAAMLDMQPAFIRRLDTEGVVCPARSAGGQRRYSRVELNHIAALAALMSEGMTLVGAQRIIELENEVAELRGQLATEMRTRARARRLAAESLAAPGTVIDAEPAQEQAPFELAPIRVDTGRRRNDVKRSESATRTRQHDPRMRPRRS